MPPFYRWILPKRLSVCSSLSDSGRRFLGQGPASLAYAAGTVGASGLQRSSPMIKNMRQVRKLRTELFTWVEGSVPLRRCFWHWFPHLPRPSSDHRRRTSGDPWKTGSFSPQAGTSRKTCEETKTMTTMTEEFPQLSGLLPFRSHSAVLSFCLLPFGASLRPDDIRSNFQRVNTNDLGYG